MRLRHALGLVLLSSQILACGVEPVASETSSRRYAYRNPAEFTHPDPNMTPGDLCDPEDRDFDGYRYRARIPHCRRNVSRDAKVAIGAAYGIDEEDLRSYEIDHYIPLSIGGSNDSENLWPLWGTWAREKSEFEHDLFEEVAAGALTQSEAIEKIRAWRPTRDDWRH